MIDHHRGAIAMAEAAVDRAHDPAGLGFARSVIASQRPEIDAMTRMLSDRTP
jgi:uncharacterized protein (DUF305 family)